MRKIFVGLLGIGLCLLPCKSEILASNLSWSTPSGIKQEEIEAFCDETFEEAIGSTIAGAAVVIMKDDKIVFEKGYGFKDIEKEELVEPESTVFEYGSTTKLFTWTSAMQLYEAGIIDLKQDIRAYLPKDFKLETQFEKPITMLDLMNHQAGFDDYIIGLFSKPDGLTDLKTALYENQVFQVHEPGYALSYSNYGAGLAGYIVECVAGEAAYDYINEHIFMPCDMKEATVNPDLSKRKDLLAQKAKGYTVNSAGVLEEAAAICIPMYPAGAGNGTAVDLAKFGARLCEEDENPMLFNSTEGIKTLLTPSYQGAFGVAGNAHGFFQYDGEKETYWHNGATANYSAFLAIVPEEDYTIAILANTDSAYAEEVIQEIGFGTVQKQKVIPTTPEANLPSTKLVEGKYSDFRQVHRGITQIAYLFPEAIEVKAISDTQITINGEVYTQIKPFLYESVETGIKGGFTVEEGKVVKYSQIIDYVPLTTKGIIKRGITYGAFILFFLALLMMIGATAVRIISGSLKKSEEGRLDKVNLFAIGTLGSYVLLVINVLSIADKISAWEHFSALKGNLYINLALGSIIGVISVFTLVTAQKSRKPYNKYIGGFYGVMSIVMLITLGTWGIFDLIR